MLLLQKARSVYGCVEVRCGSRYMWNGCSERDAARTPLTRHGTREEIIRNEDGYEEVRSQEESSKEVCREEDATKGRDEIGEHQDRSQPAPYYGC